MIERKKVVITGATSFLGSSIAEKLLRNNYEVYAIVRKNSENLYRLKGLDLNLIELDLCDIDKLDNYIKYCDIFLHFGWDGSGSEGRKNVDIQSKNFEYSVKAIKSAQRLRCKLFVFAGSQAEYGLQHGKISEHCECDPISEYGKNKLKFGKFAYEFSKDNSMQFIHLRVFSVYGMNDRPNTLVDLCINTFENGGVAKLGQCEQRWNYLYIKDFSAIILQLIKNSKKVLQNTEVDSIINIGSHDDIPMRDYVKAMYDVSLKKGTYSFNADEKNAEGSPSAIPDISKMIEITGYMFKYSFIDGVIDIMKEKFCNCILCGNRINSNSLLFFDNMPSSAQDIPQKSELNNDTGIELKLYQCEKCGLVQFNCTPVPYYKDVIRSGGYTTTMFQLRNRQYKELIEKYDLEGKKIIEIGCGQGEFLMPLKNYNISAYGIENRKDLADKARMNGFYIFDGFINDDIEEVRKQGPFDAFLSLNFIEHQPDPNKMISSIYSILNDDGVGIITAPSFEYIIDNCGYYEFIRDHIAYYTFDTLSFLLQKNGFDVLKKEMINRDTLSLTVKKRKAFNLSNLIEYKDILDQEFNSLISNYKSNDKTVSIWGASHQGFTILSSLHLSNKIQYIIDSAPFKQGLYAPASHIPIVSPQYFKENPSDAVIIIAPGYTDEIFSNLLTLSDETDIYTLRTNHIERLK